MNKVFVTYDPVAKGENGSELKMRVFIQEEDGNLYEQVLPKKDWYETIRKEVGEPISALFGFIVAVVFFVFGLNATFNTPFMLEVVQPTVKMIAYRILWVHDVLTEVIYFVISLILGALWWIIDLIF